MTKNEERLYEMLADKTLSFGCRIEGCGFKGMLLREYWHDNNITGRGSSRTFHFLDEEATGNTYFEKIAAVAIDNFKIIGKTITKERVETVLNYKGLLFSYVKIFGFIKTRKVNEKLTLLWDYSKPDDLREQPEARKFLETILL